MARTAVLQIGTNGLPWLVQWIDQKDALWRVKAVNVADKIPRRAGGMFLLRLLEDHSAQKKGELARTGFEILGTNAVSCVGDLVKTMNRWKADDFPTDIAEIIARIGPEGNRCIGKGGG